MFWKKCKTVIISQKHKSQKKKGEWLKDILELKKKKKRYEVKHYLHTCRVYKETNIFANIVCVKWLRVKNFNKKLYNGTCNVHIK